MIFSVLNPKFKLKRHNSCYNAQMSVTKPFRRVKSSAIHQKIDHVAKHETPLTCRKLSFSDDATVITIYGVHKIAASLLNGLSW